MEKYVVTCVDDDLVAWLDEGVLAFWDKNDKDDFDVDFSMHAPWNNFLRKPWVRNVYSTMVICRKLAGVIHMPTSVITITIKTRWSTMITWMMGGRRAGPIPRYTYPNTISNLYSIEQGHLVDILRPNSTSCTITPNISSLGGRVDDLGTISNSPITTDWRTLCTLDMHYGLINPLWSDILNPSIPSNPRWHAGFGWTIMKYTFYITTYKSGDGVKGDTQTDIRKDIQTNMIG